MWTGTEHDIVVLRHGLPPLNLVEGDVGAVVGVYRAGGSEAEFAAPEGEPFAQAFSPEP